MTHYFWSPRGTLTKIDKDSVVDSLIQKGFIRASQEDIEKFQPGSYFPAYDRGEQPIITPQQPKAVENTQKGFRIIKVW